MPSGAEALRHAAEEARHAAEEARNAAIAAVAATADTLSANLAQMQFLEEARNPLIRLKQTKPTDVDNRHGISRYLEDRAVASEILTAL